MNYKSKAGVKYKVKVDTAIKGQLSDKYRGNFKPLEILQKKVVERLRKMVGRRIYNQKKIKKAWARIF